MSKLASYLKERFFNLEQLAAACGASPQEIEDLIGQKLVPGPTYVVSDQVKISSKLFGEMEAKGATPGSYFHPSSVVWVGVANEILRHYQGEAAKKELERRFAERFCAALSILNETCWRLGDCFCDSGSPIASGLKVRSDSTWTHFLQGTWGMCVANPVSEAAIAEKSVLQEKLIDLSDNGARVEYSEAESEILNTVIDSYEAVSMPFSPAEYERTSRKRLIDDLRVQLKSVKA